MRVVVGTVLPRNGTKRIREFCKSFQGGCDLWEWPNEEQIPREELLKRVEGADLLLVSLRERVDAELLEAAGPQLKAISTFSVVRFLFA